MRLLPHHRAWLATSCFAVLTLLGASARAADTGAVCVYADINYGGAHTCVDADTSWIGSSWNDRASSVRLRAGIQAQLFNDINYGGRSLTLAGDTPNLVSLSFNDLMSSLKVTVACKATDWSGSAQYALGDVVRYVPDGHYYKVVNVTAGGTEDRKSVV